MLISSFYNAFALPYLATHPRFNAPIYATEPTIQLCRILFDELVALSARSTNRKRLRKGESAGTSVRLQRIAERCGLDLATIRRKWRAPFDEAAVRDCMSRMRAVGFHDRIDVLGRIQAVASSASYAIGSANWQVTFANGSDYDRFVYIGRTSTLITHPLVRF